MGTRALEGGATGDTTGGANDGAGGVTTRPRSAGGNGALAGQGGSGVLPQPASSTNTKAKGSARLGPAMRMPGERCDKCMVEAAIKQGLPGREGPRVAGMLNAAASSGVLERTPYSGIRAAAMQGVAENYRLNSIRRLLDKR